MVPRGTSRAVGIFLRLVTCTCLKVNEEETDRSRTTGSDRFERSQERIKSTGGIL